MTTTKMQHTQKELSFYDIMKYPIPQKEEQFYFEKKVTKAIKSNKNWFSWTKKAPELEKYIEYINRRHRVYKLIPCVSHIYLANSITFNAINSNSDIDICIVTYTNRIRTVRLWTLIIFSLLGIKRGRKSIRKKFCLSFYLTADTLNLYPIKIAEEDIYLIYRIAHLVPLYTEEENSTTIIRDRNKHWLQTYLPNHPMKDTIQIGNQVYKGINKTKKILNKIHSWIPWDIIEKISKTILLPRTLSKKRKLNVTDQKNIIVSDSMLKFHKDKRKKIQIKFEIYNKTNQ